MSQFPESERNSNRLWVSLFKVFWNALAVVAMVLLLFACLGVNLVRNLPFFGTPAPPQPVIEVTSNQTVLEAIRKVNKQIFIEHYNTIDIQYSEAPSAWLDRLGIRQEFVVLIRGRVPAGFDLSQVNEANIWVSADGQRVQLILPPPQVFSENVAIDFENSRVLTQRDTCPNLFCNDTLTTYQNIALPEAETMLIEAAQSNGILQQAADDGKTYYEQLLRSLGFTEVQVLVNGYD